MDREQVAGHTLFKTDTQDTTKSLLFLSNDYTINNHVGYIQLEVCTQYEINVFLYLIISIATVVVAANVFSIR